MKPGRPASPPPDIRETGAAKGGQPQTSDRRLYMQLQVFTGCRDARQVVDQLRKSGREGVVYADINDPLGIGVLLASEDPAAFAGPIRELLASGPFDSLTRLPDFTMFGRTYGTGHEPNLEFALLSKPRKTAYNPEWPWALWYPLRRRPDFAILPPEEQGKILGEHAAIGIEWGQSDYAHDVRLACYGLDRNDNEFVIGLVGKDLFPLSRIVQEMRKTQQTARYIQSLGPFFVGRAAFQSPMP